MRTARRRGVLTVLRFAPCFPSSPTRLRAQEDVRHSRAHPGTCPLRVRAQPGSWLRGGVGAGDAGGKALRGCFMRPGLRAGGSDAVNCVHGAL